MVAALVAGVEIDFARIFAGRDTRGHWDLHYLPFPCLIFQLCRDSGVPIWHCDRLVHPTGALDIGLIRDEANVAAPREPQVEVPRFEYPTLRFMMGRAGDDLGAPSHRLLSGSSSRGASMGLALPVHTQLEACCSLGEYEGLGSLDLDSSSTSSSVGSLSNIGSDKGTEERGGIVEGEGGGIVEGGGTVQEEGIVEGDGGGTVVD
ncbi:hypothetical protein H5410_001773 [Solanum commersonii]|uniref:Uncharacterized protein n=1 Tax=Solanum commersonii TaxID=4109 RepID=A0A9J6AZZ8_SOLCO|nr:hypothetical protein H5410_001773 [Solanum commersonii]